MFIRKVLVFISFPFLILKGCRDSDVPDNIEPETSQKETEEWIDVNDGEEEDETSGQPDENQNVDPEIIYNEEEDSLEGVDASDLSDLYSAFNNVNSNYTVNYFSYFNSSATRIYYDIYKKNYVQDKIGLFTSNSEYIYPVLSEYLEVMNSGMMNYSSNLYSFELAGATVEERLSSILTIDSLTLTEENTTYQDKMFTLGNLTEAYMSEIGFTRISKNKYQTTNTDRLFDFMNLTSPGMINDGFFMTFAKATIELNVSEDYLFRIRLYTPRTQIGKLIESHKDHENKPNWYLLFSEAYISDVGTTTFAPASSLLE